MAKKQGYKSDEYNDLSKFFSNRNDSSKDKEKKELERVAKLTNGKVFDGKSGLKKAFAEVRSYN